MRRYNWKVIQRYLQAAGYPPTVCAPMTEEGMQAMIDYIHSLFQDIPECYKANVHAKIQQLFSAGERGPLDPMTIIILVLLRNFPGFYAHLPRVRGQALPISDREVAVILAISEGDLARLLLAYPDLRAETLGGWSVDAIQKAKRILLEQKDAELSSRAN